MLRPCVVLLAVVGACIAPATEVVAAIHNAVVTSNAIFGSGNVNGSYTVERHNGVELGLRAKQRFPPTNVFTNDGAGTFYFPAGNDSGRPLWSFEWSINSDYNGNLGRNLDALKYSIRLDNDPTAAANLAISFDPIKAPHPVNGYWDHSIGTNGTGQGAGTEAASHAEYVDLISNNNLAQNSWRMDFFFDPVDFNFNPNIDGIYTIELAAIGDSGLPIALTRINVVVSGIPEPVALLVWGGLIGCAAVVTRRKQRLALDSCLPIA